MGYRKMTAKSALPVLCKCSQMQPSRGLWLWPESTKPRSTVCDQDLGLTSSPWPLRGRRWSHKEYGKQILLAVGIRFAPGGHSGMLRPGTQGRVHKGTIGIFFRNYFDCLALVWVPSPRSSSLSPRPSFLFPFASVAPWMISSSAFVTCQSDFVRRLFFSLNFFSKIIFSFSTDVRREHTVF